MFLDGQQVSYVGEPYEGTPNIGDVGIVVAAGHTASHVKWITGPRTNFFEEMDHHEIVAMSYRRDIVLAPVAPDVDGLIATMNDEGRLASFNSIAEDALAFVASRVRDDPNIQEVMSSLTAADGEDLVSTASISLLRDAFGDRTD